MLNGPAKWWPSKLAADGYAAIFCDSVEELAALRREVSAGRVRAGCIGVRLRPATVRSRFGVDLSDRRALRRTVSELRRLPRSQPIGFHFHQASSAIGVATWRYLARNFIAAVRILGEQVGKRPSTMSFGGGWHPDDWALFLREDLAGLVRFARSEAPGIERLILEPGKAIAQRSMCLLMRVIEARNAGRLFVVDGSVAELPDMPSHPHGFVSRASSGRLRLWGRGDARLLGRLCMEFDVVGSGLGAPRGLRARDLVAVLDAGAYDASMAYPFSRGFPRVLSGPGTL